MTLPIFGLCLCVKGTCLESIVGRFSAVSYIVLLKTDFLGERSKSSFDRVVLFNY